MKLFTATTLTDPRLIALEERVSALDGYELPNPIYVSPDGSDETGDGTEQKPFRQIQYAVSKCTPEKSYEIHAYEGEYIPFSVVNSKNITLGLLGNVTITDRDNNLNQIIVIRGCTLTIRERPSGSEVKTLNIVCNGELNGTIISSIFNSSLHIEDNIKLKIDNNSTGAGIHYVVSSNVDSHVHINPNGGFIYNGNNSPMRGIFYCLNSSNLIYFCRNLDSITHNVNMESFAYAVSNSFASFTSLGLTISNKYTYGLRAANSIICAVPPIQNNAATPISQIQGGRIFLGTSTSTTNSISDPLSPLSLDDEVVSYDSFPDDSILMGRI